MAINQFRAVGGTPAAGSVSHPRPLPAAFVRALARTEAQAIKDILVSGSAGPGEAKGLANACQGGTVAEALDARLYRRAHAGPWAVPVSQTDPVCDAKAGNGSGSLAESPAQVRAPGQQEEDARRAQAAQDDQIRANAIYAEMAAARRKAVAEAWALLANLQTELFQIWSEVYLYRQKIMQKVADQWEKLLLDGD